jgi:membrane fusion protein (multidrug efflux system)
VVSVSLGADPLSRLYEVKSLLENRDRVLRPGQFVTLVAVTGRTDSTVVAPRASLMTDVEIGPGSTAPVYVVAAGVSALRTVSIGAVAEDEVEIREGLRPGDRVVVFGQNRLRDGAKVKLHKIDGRMGEVAS